VSTERIRQYRRLSQALFFVFSLTAFFGLLTWRPAISFYNGMHLLPALASLAWLTLPPLFLATVLMLLLPLLGGRLYCSYLCPVGFLQDLAGSLARRLALPRKSAGGFTRLRLFSLVLAFSLIVMGSSLYHYLDHFSGLGRVYGLFDTLLGLTPPSSNTGAALLFLAAVSGLPFLIPRWFCGALCPSGALFSLLQKRALFRVRVGEGCTGCGECTAACPVLCMDDGKIDPELCTHCLECIGACPQDGIAFAFHRPFGKSSSAGDASGDRGRRRFLGVLAALAGGGLAQMLRVKTLDAAPAKLKTVIPPGGRSGDEFLQRCAACHACVAVCPTRVLEPSGLENGVIGLGKVRMAYGRAYCSYECNACLGVCPTGALSYYPLGMKQKIKIGSSKLDRELCLPYEKEQDCAACHEVCPTGAIEMKRQKKVFGPVLNDDYCIGCGACEHACPVQPDKAIRVEPRGIHTFAFNPKQHGPRARVDYGRIAEPEANEFPF